MIVIKDNTTYVDFNKSTFFDKYYVNLEYININISLENRLSNNIIEIGEEITDANNADRYFRWFIPQELINLDRGTYKFTLKLLNKKTAEFEEYEIGVIEREIENNNNDLKYIDNSSDVFVYNK
jgi:hypothetical protein